MQKRIEWDADKNEKLKRERGVSFEDMLEAITSEDVLDDIEHERRNNQRIKVIKFRNYAFRVPYVEDTHKIFLKTIFPCRKSTKKYLRNNK